MDNKHKCPYCGAELQENARYCPFCMRETGERKAKKKGVIAVIAAAFVLCAVVLVAAGVVIGVLVSGILPLGGTDIREGDNAPESGESLTDGSTAELPYEQWPVITEYEDMLVRAVYLSAVDDLSRLWDPNDFVPLQSVSDNDGDRWEIYENNTYMDGVTVRTHFCEGGREIATSITGLKEQNYSEGISIAECMISSVYNYTYSNLHDMFTTPDVYPRFAYEPGDDLLSISELPDPWRTEDMTLEGCYAQLETQIGVQLLYLEFRTRVTDGGTLYDIVIVHTQDL